MSLKKIINNDTKRLGGMIGVKCRKPVFPESVEWPTVFLLTAFWLAFGLLTFSHDHIAGWVMIPLAG